MPDALTVVAVPVAVPVTENVLEGKIEADGSVRLVDCPGNVKRGSEMPEAAQSA